MKILKFGGKSASNNGIHRITRIIENQYRITNDFCIVLSARGDTTNKLEVIMGLASTGNDYMADLLKLKAYQLEPYENLNLDSEFTMLDNNLRGISLVGDYSRRSKDLILAQGEIMAIKTLAAILESVGIPVHVLDSREIIKTDDNYGNARLLETLSRQKTREYFSNIPKGKIPLVSGFISSDLNGETTTLGRNGSNYTASLLAKFLNASIVESYTDVDGVFTANPRLVPEAKSIDMLSFADAAEIAGFGASILHPKTIIPLEEGKIPLLVKNTFNPEFKGTLICDKQSGQGVKSITHKDDICIIKLEGKALLGKKGIDARVFQTLYTLDISVGLIAQGSSERYLGFVIDKNKSDKAVSALKTVFQNEISNREISSICAICNISLVSIIGIDINGFGTAFKNLKKNNIDILLINNAISGDNVSLLIENNSVNKALNLIHSQIFGINSRLNIAVFGKGNVGASLIDQIIRAKKNILERRGLELNIFAIAGTEKVLINKNGLAKGWRKEIEYVNNSDDVLSNIIKFTNQNHLENLVAIDNTSSFDFTDHYFSLLENGFDLVSSNKIANTRSISFYGKLRDHIKACNKQYLYETNVGAGLPLIDTIKLLHASGENITCIKGVFSGSLSYIFNNFSVRDDKFSKIVLEAIDGGLMEPDPREDLSGKDVARKLLILARELDLKNELLDVKVENLVPQEFTYMSASEFVDSIHKLDKYFSKIKSQMPEGHVLRYVGNLHGDLQKNKGLLDVELAVVPLSATLGNIHGSDSIFEIYTHSYGNKPIVIQGAGAGAEVTARGVFGDILRITDKIK
jgi:aspartate kinase